MDERLPGDTLPMEFWVGFSGDPKNNLNTVSTRTIYLSKPDPMPGEDLLHVRQVDENSETFRMEIISMTTKLASLEGFLKGSIDGLVLRLDSIDSNLNFKGGHMAKKIMKKKKITKAAKKKASKK